MGVILVISIAVLAAIVAFNQSVHKSFLYVYIPTLILFPNYYFYNFIGIPDPNFNQAVILVLFGIWMMQGLQGWRFTFTDVLVFAYAFSNTYSEFINIGYDDAQNLGFDMIASVLLPYTLAKSIIVQNNISIDIAKLLTLLLVLVFALSSYQYITSNPYTLWQQILGTFFGHQGWGWVTRYREGLPRLAGPFAHAILFATAMFSCFWLAMWLARKQVWKQNILNLSPSLFGYLIALILFVAGFAGLSRGPLGAWFVAGTITLIGFTKYRWALFSVMMLLLIGISIPIVNLLTEYASLRRIDVGFGSMQETVIYRTQLIQNYVEIANQSYLWGWGHENFPTVTGQKSIDNYYLLLYLEHGIIALGSFLLTFLYVGIRLFIRVMTQPVVKPSGSSLGFSLLSILIVFAISVATVYLGQQLLPMYFLFLGWSEGYLFQRNFDFSGQVIPTTSRRLTGFQFKRVLQ
ncbi:O-antigen ligase family protein [Candidatus Albibeggiatoa sp. nov. NOAA]|uniref:O-antigen ligase family protein n=1 Tax=Candidatus Albibeggiatoa sp. nov. NOAA TaxID=3162724 RepID=UPI0033040D94|nr:O-antigen ligase family protein [Thiotrichaceae bacterium]